MVICVFCGVFFNTKSIVFFLFVCLLWFWYFNNKIIILIYTIGGVFYKTII